MGGRPPFGLKQLIQLSDIKLWAQLDSLELRERENSENGTFSWEQAEDGSLLSPLFAQWL